MIEVLRAGLQTTIQDAGRQARALGIPASGAADQVALRLANALVGNGPDTAALEITLAGPRLRFHAQTVLSLVGAPFTATLDGLPFPERRAVRVEAGQELDIAGTARGMRAILGVRGGVRGQEAFGSLSTDLKGGFGGLEGRALRAGDWVDWSPPAWAAVPKMALSPDLLTPCAERHLLRVIPTPDATAAQLGELLGRSLQASRQADRMGVRLLGSVQAHHDPSRVSLPNVPGMIQLPPDGRPILLLPDAGTHGGYPTPLVVIRADLAKLAQIRPGDFVTLIATDAATATALLRDQQLSIRQVEQTLAWWYAQR